MSEIDHTNTSEVICPYCGDEFEDAWEWSSNSGEHECDCGNTFEYEREVEVTYSTNKKARGVL